MRGGQFVNTFIDRHRRRNVVERNVVSQRVQVDLGLNGRVSKYRFRLGCIYQFAVEHAVIKRLFAKPVAGNDEFFLPRVP